MMMMNFVYKHTKAYAMYRNFHKKLYSENTRALPSLMKKMLKGKFFDFLSKFILNSYFRIKQNIVVKR